MRRQYTRAALAGPILHNFATNTFMLVYPADSRSMRSTAATTPSVKSAVSMPKRPSCKARRGPTDSSSNWMMNSMASALKTTSNAEAEL